MPNTTEYDKSDDTFYFRDFETMATVMPSEINKTFKDWHWNKKKFTEKYEQYLNNIDKNQDIYKALQNNIYEYAVKCGTSDSDVVLKSKEAIKGKYFWITKRDGDSVVFF